MEKETWDVGRNCLPTVTSVFEQVNSLNTCYWIQRVSRIQLPTSPLPKETQKSNANK